MRKIKRLISILLICAVSLGLAACGKETSASAGEGSLSAAEEETEGTTLVYGSNDYTRINPAMDEHGEINDLLFDRLTDHD